MITDILSGSKGIFGLNYNDWNATYFTENSFSDHFKRGNI